MRVCTTTCCSIGKQGPWGIDPGKVFDLALLVGHARRTGSATQLTPLPPPHYGPGPASRVPRGHPSSPVATRPIASGEVGGRTDAARSSVTGAIRCLYNHAVADKLITESDNPAKNATKPRRLASTRRGLPDNRLNEINHIAATTGDDPRTRHPRPAPAHRNRLPSGTPSAFERRFSGACSQPDLVLTDRIGGVAFNGFEVRSAFRRRPDRHATAWLLSAS